MPLAHGTTTSHKDWTTPVPQMSVDLGAAALKALPQSVIDNWTQTHGGQVPTIQPTRIALVLHCIIAKPSADDPITVFASLENSLVSSGTMRNNQSDLKGYFQDQVKVEMWLEGGNGQPRTDLYRISDGPSTVNGTGSISSSVSVSVSGGANAGFFGAEPTGGVNLGASISDSHSFSSNLEDFRTVNTSDQYRAVHQYLMSKSANGPAYNGPADLVPNSDNMTFSQSFRGIQLFTPPDLAIANLPLISQCIWQANHTNMIAETITLRIRLTQHTVMVDGTNNFARVDWHYSAVTPTYSHTEDLPLQMLVDPAKGGNW